MIYFGKFEKNDVEKIYSEIVKYGISVIFNFDIKDLVFIYNWLILIVLCWIRGKVKRYRYFKNDIEINKMVFWYLCKKKLYVFVMMLKERFREICEIVFIGNCNEVLEFILIGLIKGLVEIVYVKVRGVSFEECVYIGDILNDVICVNCVG